MSSRDTSFELDRDYRDISDRDLYYDLGYTIADKSKANITSSTLALYLFGVSLIQVLFFQIPQTFTILIVLLYAVLFRFGGSSFDTTKKALMLALVMVANIFDHLQAGLTVNPGSLTSNGLTVGDWIAEILWVLLYGLEFITLYGPIQEPATVGKTVNPTNEITRNNYENLRKRIRGSDFHVTDFKEDVDTSLLQVEFRNQVQYLTGIFLLIVLLDVLIWKFMDLISGGNNVSESYFVSGVSFIIYVLLIAFSGNFFRREKK